MAPWRLPLSTVLMVKGAAAQSASLPGRQFEPLLREQAAVAGARDTERLLANYLNDATLVVVFNRTVVREF